MADKCEIGKCEVEKCEVEGTLIDFVTGEEVADTVVERIRQDIERFLVENKNYSKNDIEIGKEFEIVLDGEITKLKADLIVRVRGRRVVIIKCTYDSLVSKERLVLSYARLFESYQIPFCVIANVEGAEVLDTISGKVIGNRLEAIPSKDDLNIKEIEFKELAGDRIEKEKRILVAFESIDEAMCNSKL